MMDAAAIRDLEIKLITVPLPRPGESRKLAEVGAMHVTTSIRIELAKLMLSTGKTALDGEQISRCIEAGLRKTQDVLKGKHR